MKLQKYEKYTNKITIRKKFGKWAQEGVPHKNWRCLDVEDTGELDFICEMCEKEEIRVDRQNRN